MTYKKFNILYFIIVLFLILLAWPFSAHSYNVSGVVEFSYRNYETKVGSSRTSQSTFGQNYRADVQDYLFDPRFLQFGAGIGYAIYDTKSNSTSQDSSILNYNLNASFFPQSKVNGTIFGNKATATIDSNANIAGYDVTTTSYGAALNLLFSGARAGGNNNYNYNNNNANGRGYPIPLPSITISHIHTDSESESAPVPIHEKRDDTNGSLGYQFNPSFDIRLDGAMQTYENEINNSSYEQKTADVASTINVTKDGELRLNGRITDMSTDNISGFQAETKTYNYGAMLDFKERNGWKQYYRYDYTGQNTSNSEYTTQRAQANVSYRLLPELQLTAGINYSIADLFTQATVSAPEVQANVKQADALAGASYQKTYPLLYRLNFNTNYDFNFGYSKVESHIAGIQDGTGTYYTNQAGLGLASSGWEKESVNLSYFILSKRDNSPLSNDIFQQTFRFDFNTRRVTDTNIRARVDYYSVETKSSASNVFSTLPADTREQRRSFTYDIAADYFGISNLTLSAGAQRGETKSSFTTLSSLQPVSSVKNIQNVYYASAVFNYSFTRNLLYRLNYMEQLSSSEVVDTRSHILGMNLDYRFRQVFVNFEYRWRQEDPDNAQTSTQQYYFVKLSRPF